MKEIARRCHLEYDEYVEEHDIFTADNVIHTLYLGDIQPGTIAAHQFRMMCKKDGKEVAGFHFLHKICDEQNPFPVMEDSYEIFGEPTHLKVIVEGMLNYAGEVFSTSAAPSD